MTESSSGWPSPFIWHELVTPDQRASGQFFRELLHWTSREGDAGPLGTATLFSSRLAYTHRGA